VVLSASGGAGARSKPRQGVSTTVAGRRAAAVAGRRAATGSSRRQAGSSSRRRAGAAQAGSRRTAGRGGATAGRTAARPYAPLPPCGRGVGGEGNTISGGRGSNPLGRGQRGAWAGAPVGTARRRPQHERPQRLRPPSPARGSGAENRGTSKRARHSARRLATLGGGDSQAEGELARAAQTHPARGHQRRAGTPTGLQLPSPAPPQRGVSPDLPARAAGRIQAARGVRGGHFGVNQRPRAYAIARGSARRAGGVAHPRHDYPLRRRAV
jgi:hypothetical protein